MKGNERHTEKLFAQWRLRWAEWRGEKIDMRTVEALLHDLTRKQLDQFIAAEIKLLSSVARKFRDVPKVPKGVRGVARQIRRADKIAGRPVEGTEPVAPNYRPRGLFSKTKGLSGELVAAQQGFAATIKKQSYKYIKRLVAGTQFSPTLVPKPLARAKREHIIVVRKIKELT